MFISIIFTIIYMNTRFAPSNFFKEGAIPNQTPLPWINHTLGVENGVRKQYGPVNNLLPVFILLSPSSFAALELLKLFQVLQCILGRTLNGITTTANSNVGGGGGGVEKWMC